MRRKLYSISLFFLILTSELVFGERSHKTKTHKTNKSYEHSKDKSKIERLKRSLDEEDKTFWASRGKKQIDYALNYSNKNDNQEGVSRILKERDLEDEPFWGTRGRRDSDTENYADEEYPEYVAYDHSNCKDCYGVQRFIAKDKSLRSSDENVKPFWGNRGRRDSNEVKDSNPFWGNRGRRYDNEPFWGTRGRRKDEPFWGARGRRESDPFWGNRGRRSDEPFWGNRGRRQDAEPFWGNRGRRQESEPFWGNRGRRDMEPFWSNRGRQNEDYWEADSKKELKESIMGAISDVKNDIERLSRLKKDQSSFWSNRGRDSKLQALFNQARSKSLSHQIPLQHDMNLRRTDPGTVTDSRVYADQPNYILVERSSRSSGEDDPFFITRGKKYNLNYKLFKAARDRRGAIEDIVKSVRNDPYYIARGKKNDVNTNSTDGQLTKVKELICSAIDLISSKENKVKREIDSDRERRTILKKLAAQLQNDPYFVSRGKKSDNSTNEEYLREFLNEIADKC